MNELVLSIYASIALLSLCYGLNPSCYSYILRRSSYRLFFNLVNNDIDSCNNHFRRQSSIHAQNPPQSKPKTNRNSNPEEYRLNKCLGTLSRRGADDAINEGRVSVNGQIASIGTKVRFGDIIKLDDKLQKWEHSLTAKLTLPAKVVEERNFIYLKYWKPRGITCTNDPQDKTNILTAGRFNLFPQRLFTVGRLDKDSTGLILLTSDGRVNNVLLNPATKREKVYEVEFDKIPSDDQMQRLRDGVEITTPIQRESPRKKSITAKTLPCKIFRIGDQSSRKFEFTLTEGRNRQIRRMAEAVGLEVVSLHRTVFAGIRMKGVTEGEWAELSAKEMEYILKAIVACQVKDESVLLDNIE